MSSVDGENALKDFIFQNVRGCFSETSIVRPFPLKQKT